MEISFYGKTSEYEIDNHSFNLQEKTGMEIVEFNVSRNVCVNLKDSKLLQRPDDK